MEACYARNTQGEPQNDIGVLKAESSQLGMHWQENISAQA